MTDEILAKMDERRKYKGTITRQYNTSHQDIRKNYKKGERTKM